MTREATPLRKISTATIVGKVPNPPDSGVKALWICIGQATGFKEGESQYGPFTALVGNFEAVNLETGEAFISSQCFLPEPFNGAIAGKLKAGGNLAVDFALEIGIKAPGKNSQQRYEYTTRPIHDPEQADPLAHLRKRVPKMLEDDKGKGGKK